LWRHAGVPDDYITSQPSNEQKKKRTSSGLFPLLLRRFFPVSFIERKARQKICFVFSLTLSCTYGFTPILA